jgi:transcriptional regulator with XRE-family HTH domain
MSDIMKMTLRAARLRRRLTQDDLAAKSGVDQTHISGIETGRRYPSDDVRKRLAKALRITPSSLQFEKPQPTATVSNASDKEGHGVTEAMR